MSEMEQEQELVQLRSLVDELQAQLRECRSAAQRSETERAKDFHRMAAEALTSRADTDFCMIHIDIERFKLFNEWYGREEGDHLIARIEMMLMEKAKQSGGLGAHFSADTFALLLPAVMCDAAALECEVQSWVEGFTHRDRFLPAIGIYRIDRINLPISTMCDRAALAADSVKGNYTRRIALYEEKMGRSLALEQALLSDFRRAIEQGEFILYAQPKCTLRTGKIVGSEMLVRWQHPRKGLLLPGTFIPILERNKLILDLDMFVWEETCRLLRRWIDKGYHPLATSVNVSRADIYEMDLCGILSELVERYDLPASLLELEITESAYTQDADQVAGVVDELRRRGFTVLMDDFGSGYSSLNMLKEIDVDILKLDLKFLQMDEKTTKRGSDILESVVQMAKWMGLRVITEGIETSEHVDFLLCIGCEYGQGYYFYRPMCIDDFEKLMTTEGMLDHRGIARGMTQEFELTDLLASNIVSEAFLNNLLGGVAIYDFYQGQLALVQVNEGYYRATGCNPVDLEMKRDDIGAQVLQEDWSILMAALEKAEARPTVGTEAEFRRRRLSGDIMWMRIRLFFLGEQKGHKRFYASVSDVTRRCEAEQYLRDSQKQLRAVLGAMGEGDPFCDAGEENRRSAALVFSRLAPTGMIGGYCEAGIPVYLINDAAVHMMGYPDRETLIACCGGLIRNMIHPDDITRIEAEIGSDFYEGKEYVLRYRMLRCDGSWFWALDRGHVLRAEDGRLATVSAFIDVTEAVAIEHRLEFVMRQTGLIVWEYEPARDLLRLYAAGPNSLLVRLDAAEQYPNFLARGADEKGGSDAAKALLDEIARLARGGAETPCAEQGVALPAGKDLWIEVTETVDRDGVAQSLVGTVQDVTEQHTRDFQQPDAAQSCRFGVQTDPLRKENCISAMEAFSEQLPVGMIGYYQEAGHPIYFVNEEMLRMAGEESFDALNERLGGNAMGLVHPDDRADAEARDNREKTGPEDHHARFRLLRRDQSWIWIFETRRAVKRREGRTAFLCTCVDISEQVALEQSFERFRQNTPCDMFRTRGGNFEFFSTNLAPHLGYTQQEYAALIRERNGAALTFHEDKPRVWAESYRALECQEDLEFVFRSVCKDGSLKQLCVQAARGVDERGELCYNGFIADISGLVDTSRQTSVSEKHLNLALRQVGLDVWEYDPAAKRLRLLSVGAGSRVGVFLDEELLQNFPDGAIQSGRIAAESHQAALNFAGECVRGKRGINIDLKILSKTGESAWLRIIGDGISNNREFPYAVGSIRDVTSERLRNMDDLENRKFIEALSENLELDWRINLTQNGSIGSSSGEEWMRRIGVDSSTDYCGAVIRAAQIQVDPQDREQILHFMDRERLLQSFEHGVFTDSLDYRRSLPSGIRWGRVIFHLVKLDDTQEVYGYIYIMDIDEEKRREQALIQRAERDSLTGLYNRQTAFRLIQKEMGEICAQGGSSALMMLDLDNFKQINDCYGHVYGDAVLSENAAKLREFFRDQDIVCRLGGDEFMMFCAHITQENAVKKAASLLRKVERTYTSGGHNISLSASIGIAMMPEHGREFTGLYDRADIALYRAKNQGKNFYCIFQEEMNRVRPPAGLARNEVGGRQDFSGSLAEHLFRVLYGSSEPHRAVREVLELTAMHFGAQCAGFGVWESGLPTAETALHWCEEDLPHHNVEEFTRLLADHSEEVCRLYGQDEIIHIEDFALLGPELARSAKSIGLSALLLSRSSMGEWGEGYLFFANFSEGRGPLPGGENDQQIKTIEEVIGIFFARMLSEERHQRYRTLMEALITRQDAGIYIVNSELRIVYYNQNAKETCEAVDVGQFCYRGLRGLDAPCNDCPLWKMNEEVRPVVIRQLELKHFSGRVQVSASRIDWPNEGACTLVMMTAIEGEGTTPE